MLGLSLSHQRARFVVSAQHTPNQYCETLWNCIQRALLCQHNTSRFYALVLMPYQASSGSHCSAEHSVFLESLFALLKCGALREKLRIGAVYEWVHSSNLECRGVQWKDTSRSGWSCENWFHDCSVYLHDPCFFCYSCFFPSDNGEFTIIIFVWSTAFKNYFKTV